MFGGQKGLTGRHGRMGGNFGFVGIFTVGLDGVTKFAAGTAVFVEEVETEAAMVDNDTAGTAVEVDIKGPADAAVVVIVITEAAEAAE